MIVPAMDHAAVFREALADWDAMDRKCQWLLVPARRAAIKSRKTVVHCERWRSPNHNHWFLSVVATKKALRRYGLVHWLDWRGRLWAARVNPKRMLVITPHFIQRYGERHSDEPRHLERLWQLWNTWPDLYATPLGYHHQGREVYGMATPHGIGLGMKEHDHIVVVRTFVDNQRLGLLQRQWAEAQLQQAEQLRHTSEKQTAAHIHHLEQHLSSLEQRLTWADLPALLKDHIH